MFNIDRYSFHTDVSHICLLVSYACNLPGIFSFAEVNRAVRTKKWVAQYETRKYHFGSRLRHINSAPPLPCWHRGIYQNDRESGLKYPMLQTMIPASDPKIMLIVEII